MTENTQIDHTVNLAIIEQLEKVLEQRLTHSKDILTDRHKKLISEMLFLYELDTDEMIKAIISAITEDH